MTLSTDIFVHEQIDRDALFAKCRELLGATEIHCEADCDGTDHFAKACWLSVDFDTAYSYRDEQGRGCGDFHACLVATLGQWLDDRGVPWSWRNEFTGEVHGGDDRYERLTDLMQGGHRAMEWFQSTVKPAIAAHIRNGDAL